MISLNSGRDAKSEESQPTTEFVGYRLTYSQLGIPRKLLGQEDEN